MKTPEEYLKDVDWMDKWVWTIEAEAEEIIKQVQKNAYNQALEDAVGNASVTYIDLTNNEEFDYTDVINDDNVAAVVAEQSILKLKIE